MSETARTHRLGLEEQRQTIVAEYREKVGHHELQAAHAEEERRLLQGQLWRQKLEFREAHQQSLTEMEELLKFQSSTFDTIARRKLIEDENTILELSGRVQELQNEVNCNDKQTSGCEDHKCAHIYRRVGGMMTNVHVAILSKSLHICEKKKKRALLRCTGCASHVCVDWGAACASLCCMWC